MIQKRHNEYSKKFMQKILMFIDSVLINATNSEGKDANKTLVSGILNARDAILSEIIRDNQIEAISQFIIDQENAKKNQDIVKEDQKDLSQEIESVKNQPE